MIKLSIAGCGDAFGSGGRLQTCYHLEADGRQLLIDCGATALIGLERLGIDPNEVEAILISHLHGDHFSGLVWWLIHAQHVARRQHPLTIVGPPGIGARFEAAVEALFPGALAVNRAFELRILEISAEKPLDLGGIKVTATEVSHPSGAPSHALRIETSDRTIAFTGDTEWVDALVEVADGADLLIAECYGFEHHVRHHMTWRIIEGNLDRLNARRVLLVHMSNEMLANIEAITDPRIIVGEDSLSLAF